MWSLTEIGCEATVGAGITAGAAVGITIAVGVGARVTGIAVDIGAAAVGFAVNRSRVGGGVGVTAGISGENVSPGVGGGSTLDPASARGPIRLRLEGSGGPEDSRVARRSDESLRLGSSSGDDVSQATVIPIAVTANPAKRKSAISSANRVGLTNFTLFIDIDKNGKFVV